jgi:pSer/pThr/pTyr-binding forkhead associated (FHA) protein
MVEARAQLAVVRGPDRGKKWVLLPTEHYDIGRSSENRIVLLDGTVSKRHALIEFVDGIWFIQDLGSKHGTFVNDGQLTERRALFHKDMVRIGKTHLVFGSLEGAGS